MQNELEKIINLVNENDYVVICLSGGPDSMCLLHLLIAARDEKFFNIVAAHVNHNVRKESEKEAEFVKKYCLDHNVIYEFMKIENYSKENFHKEARDIRYDFFEKVINKYKAPYLFTAHHGDDLIESIMMKLVRGSRFYGYLGFKEITKRDNYIIYRPLINKTKKEIEEYDQKNHIPYVIDNSNKSDKYKRNRYRNHVLPLLKQEEAKVHLKFKKFSDIIDEHYEFVYELALKKLKQVYKDQTLEIDKFLMAEKLIQKYIIEEILYEIYDDKINLINDEHVNLIFKLINSQKQNNFITLPNLIITKSYNKLYFGKNVNKSSVYSIVFNNKVELSNKMIIEQIKSSDEKSNFVLRLDSQEIVLPLKIRSRKNGDRMMIKNLNGSRKIKDIFIDNKIELSNRDNIPIVTDSNDKILWIPGVKKSKFDKEKYENHDIILKYYEKGEII